jgi:hypothetical protein
VTHRGRGTRIMVRLDNISEIMLMSFLFRHHSVAVMCLFFYLSIYLYCSNVLLESQIQVLANVRTTA